MSVHVVECVQNNITKERWTVSSLFWVYLLSWYCMKKTAACHIHIYPDDVAMFSKHHRTFLYRRLYQFQQLHCYSFTLAHTVNPRFAEILNPSVFPLSVSIKHAVHNITLFTRTVYRNCYLPEEIQVRMQGKLNIDINFLVLSFVVNLVFSEHRQPLGMLTIHGNSRASCQLM